MEGFLHIGQRSAAGARGSTVLAVALLACLALPGYAVGQQPALTQTATAQPALMSPFPVVRAVVRSTPRGARITRMTVRAPVGAYIVSECVGAARACPYGLRESRIGGRVGSTRTVHVRAFERSFRSGVVLRVYVVNDGRMGKYTRLRIRRRSSPLRSDSCVAERDLRPVRCPASALLSPFPVVRIVGRTTRRGVKISRMTVRAQVGTYIVTRCVGPARACPYRERTSQLPGYVGRTRTVHVRGLERSFRAGVVLRVYVIENGKIGKYTRFRIRRGRAPARSDRCVTGFEVLKAVNCLSR